MHQRPLARYTLLAAAIAGHILLIKLLFSGHIRSVKTLDPSVSSRPVLLWLELPPPQPPSKNEAEHIGSLHTRPLKLSATSRPLDTAIHTPASNSPIDWYREADEVVRETDLGALALRQSGCDEFPRRGSLRPRCKKGRANYRWDPEPKRASFSGGIPYVRLGKRCVVALGGFGCAIGKLRKGGGDLFERMRDPDRPTSSVPDIPRESMEEPTRSVTGAPYK